MSQARESAGASALTEPFNKIISMSSSEIFKPFNDLVMYSLFVIVNSCKNDRWGDISRPIGQMLVLVPSCRIGLHQYGTSGKIPSWEKVCDSLGYFLNGRFIGILLDKGVSVHYLFSNASGHFLCVNRCFPIGVSKYLTFREKNHIIFKRI